MTHAAAATAVIPLHRKRAAAPYFYSMPALVLILALVLVPLCVGISYAFRSMSLTDPASGGFIGLEHFRALARDRDFLRALENTVVWTASSVFLQFLLGLGLALLLNRPFRGRAVAQTLIFLPWAVPPFLTALTWAWLINPVIGPLPHWLSALGLMAAPTNILGDPDVALWGPIIANVWWGIPFFAITTLAALQSIPRDIHEAAAIDGASAWQRFRSMTLPLLAPTLTMALLLRTVWVANFADLIVVMTDGGPADRTQIVSSYIFTMAFHKLDFGYAAAVSLVLLGLLLVYALLILQLRKSLLAKD